MLKNPFVSVQPSVSTCTPTMSDPFSPQLKHLKHVEQPQSIYQGN